MSMEKKRGWHSKFLRDSSVAEAGKIIGENKIDTRLHFSEEEKAAFELYLAACLNRHQADELSYIVKRPETEIMYKTPILSAIARGLNYLFEQCEQTSEELTAEGDEKVATQLQRSQLKKISNLISSVYTQEQETKRGKKKNKVDEIVTYLENQQK